MKKLSRTELKNVMGGDAPAAGCTAQCVNAQAVTVSCTVGCTARDNIGSFCDDGTKKCCYEGAPCFAD